MALSVMVMLMVLLMVCCGGVSGLTMTAKEAADLPDELKPIVPGGSWFDDMAIKRLRMRHKELKEIGRTEGEEDSEEMFIMAKLKDPEIIPLLPQQHQPTTPEMTLPLLHHHQHQHQPTPPTPSTTPKTQDTREALRSFLRHNKNHNSRHTSNDRISSTSSDTTTKEFMEVYERELHSFFENFMSAMLQAEIGGVSIEHRSEERKEVEEDEVSAQRSNDVNNP